MFAFSEPVNRKPSNPSLFDTHRSPARRSHIRWAGIFFSQHKINIFSSIILTMDIKLKCSSVGWSLLHFFSPQSEETCHPQQWHHLIIWWRALWAKEKQEHDSGQEQVSTVAFSFTALYFRCSVSFHFSATKTRCVEGWSFDRCFSFFFFFFCPVIFQITVKTLNTEILWKIFSFNRLLFLVTLFPQR